MRARILNAIGLVVLLGGCDQDANNDEQNPCEPDPCVNGACTDEGDTYRCDCDPGWDGADCDVDIDDCTPDPCVHGTCTDLINGHSCECDPGWDGTDCDVGCGDGVVTSPEVCDGSELNGQTCVSHGFTGGTLTCASDCLSIDTSACVTTTVPQDWTCDASLYDDGLACDCECGAYDVDCDDPALTISNCQAAETCDASGHCQDDCTQVPVDQYEANDTCALAQTLPDALEGATAVTVSAPTLHHIDQTPDTDWFAIMTVEGEHSCVPYSAQCYFLFDIAFTPPDVAAHANYEMCVTRDTCGGTELCTTGADWNATAGRYELSVLWEGVCGLTDDTQLYVKIARNGGQESCEPYSLEYQLTYTDEACP